MHEVLAVHTRKTQRPPSPASTRTINRIHYDAGYGLSRSCVGNRDFPASRELSVVCSGSLSVKK